MRKRSIYDLPRENGRSAFTLIELMVVIAILAALAALTAGAVIKYLGSQQEANTKSTLSKTKSQLDKAWSKVKDQAYGETIPPAYLPGIKALAGTDANAAGRVRVIYVKLKLRQAFPMSFNEALNTTSPPSPLPALPAYVTYLHSVGVSGSIGAAYESSACLLMALQRGVSGAGIDPSQLTSGGATGMAGSLPYLTDAWGQPIYFSRVPTGSTTLNPAGPQPAPLGYSSNDPGDPQGYLQMASWGTTYGPSFSAVTLQQLAPGNTSYKLAPMVASSGLDKVPQFNPITFAPTVAGADDLFCHP